MPPGLVQAYDVFLNTSLWEGVSVATMEAVAAGIPVVGSGGGGPARKPSGPRATLLGAGASDAELGGCGPGGGVRQARSRPCAANGKRCGGWRPPPGHGCCCSGPDATPLPAPRTRCDVLFVTGNLDAGGAQRSLCNLVAEWPARGLAPAVAVCGSVGVPGFAAAARAAGVPFLDLSGAPGQVDGLRGRAGRILGLVAAIGPRTVCFWNMDAATKIAVARVLCGGPVRVADVSPGPMLYAELDAERDTARLLSWSPEGYLGALDVLVSKYARRGPAGPATPPPGHPQRRARAGSRPGPRRGSLRRRRGRTRRWPWSRWAGWPRPSARGCCPGSPARCSCGSPGPR